MSLTVSKTELFTSGSISFSSLRSSFKETSSGSISASELRRDTDVTETDPIVPDSTENRNSGTLSDGISTSNNLKLSQFRNSIKYYYITESGTEINFDIDNPTPVDWNTNLDKNINKVPDTLDEKIWKEIESKINIKQSNQFQYSIENTDRAVGTRLSHYVFKKYNNDLPDDAISLKLDGSAGQSLGAFLAAGITLVVSGDANDYVGKGLSGGKIIVRLNDKSKIKSNDNVIVGNTVLYGATKGKLFASGKAGERFAVRNSGATAVVEGCGSNGCEYMTGGSVAILGDVGDNFGAGMTGGMAFIYDPKNKFENYVNATSIVWQPVETPYWKDYLKNLLKEFKDATDSKLSNTILNKFEEQIKFFKQVCPIEMLDKLDNPISLKSKSKIA